MRLVITEKPSVARDLGRVLGVGRRGEGCLEGDGIVITWCIGHLLELEEPGHYDDAWRSWRLDTLPMVPERFVLRVRSSASDQWAVVRRLLRDRRFDEVVNACDAGREGEHIFRTVYEHAGSSLPVKRFWVSSLTDAAIREGWRRLEPAARYDPLAAAARCRSEADWLVGMNATRAMTCRTRQEGGDALWSVGRVQTPTLAMIVGRDAEIEAFVPETYHRVEATLAAQGFTWTARFTREPGGRPERRRKGAPKEAPRAERFASEDEARAVAQALQGQTGTVRRARRRTKRDRPPLLYDLTALQRRANQRYGLSAQRTLEVAQALYERHKLITYPRTDARHLTSDQTDGLPGLVEAVGGLAVYEPFAKGILAGPLRLGPRIVDDDEVGDHHAILPTDRTPDPRRLSADEKRIYDLVARRFLAVLSEDALFDLTDLMVEVPPAPGAKLPDDVPVPIPLQAKGRVCRQEGWQAADPPGKKRDRELPPVDEGDPTEVQDTEVKEGQTRPPRPHDDASLLRAMETAGRSLDDRELARALRSAGLGTPATRASILQTLLDRRYVQRQGRALRSTATGRALIEALPVEELTSAELTGRWERRLSEMAEGKEDRSAFMADVARYVGSVTDQIARVEVPQAARVRTRKQSKALGDCPTCGKPVRVRGTVYTCDSGRECPFVVPLKMAKRRISQRMLRTLLTERRTEPVKGFKSRKGKPFSAGLEVREDGSVGFWFPERHGGGDRGSDRGARPPSPRRDGPPAVPPPPGATPVGRPCPTCGEGRVIAGRHAWGCSRWREGCTWRLAFVDPDGRRRDPAAVAASWGRSG